jgi:hypothetical protein
MCTAQKPNCVHNSERTLNLVATVPGCDAGNKRYARNRFLGGAERSLYSNPADQQGLSADQHGLSAAGATGFEPVWIRVNQRLEPWYLMFVARESALLHRRALGRRPGDRQIQECRPVATAAQANLRDRF